MKLKIQAGTTGRIIRVYLQDLGQPQSVAGLTGLVYNSAGLALAYAKVGDTAATVVTLSAGVVGTWSSGGFVAVDATNLPGMYEIGLPNAALTGSTDVHLLLSGAANMPATPIEIELDTINYQVANGKLPVTLNSNDVTGNLPAAVNSPTDSVFGTVSDTAQTTTVFKAAAGLSIADNFYSGMWLVFTSGQNKPIPRAIVGYVGATSQFTVSPAFPNVPTNGDAFELVGHT